ncbi:hypothetical protein, partial [Klebsiella pneumoniae]|uniref:hypothetical protein n=1 Tax=Klebsiella pneumoniae TaxID=573 RepID=UPI0021641012
MLVSSILLMEKLIQRMCSLRRMLELLPELKRTMSWNAAGGATSSYLKGDNPFTGGLINGLASGVGYGAGKLIELPVDKIYNPMKPWKDWLWTDVGMGISKPLSLDPIPRVAGN